jgi:hypothetical protein
LNFRPPLNKETISGIPLFLKPSNMNKLLGKYLVIEDYTIRKRS